MHPLRLEDNYKRRERDGMTRGYALCIVGAKPKRRVALPYLGVKGYCPVSHVAERDLVIEHAYLAPENPGGSGRSQTDGTIEKGETFRFCRETKGKASERPLKNEKMIKSGVPRAWGSKEEEKDVAGYSKDEERNIFQRNERKAKGPWYASCAAGHARQS